LARRVAPCPKKTDTSHRTSFNPQSSEHIGGDTAAVSTHMGGTNPQARPPTLPAVDGLRPSGKGLAAWVFRETMGLSMVTRCMSVAVAALFAAGIAGCATPPQSVTSTTAPVSNLTTTSTPSSTEPATVRITTSTVSTTTVTTTPNVADTTTTVSPVAPTTVPPAAEPIGEAYDFWVPVPSEGAILGVVGVRHDDMLNIRSGPDVTFDVIATLEPTRTGVAGTGEGWQLPSGSVWWRIEADGVDGWANQQFLSRLGGVDDLTSFVVGQLEGIPVAETMLDLGLIVANTFVDVDGGSHMVVSIASTVSDLGEVAYDVTGLGDDSVGGYRLHIFGQPTDSGGGFSLMAVEATTMCQRGVWDGLCV
jgi:hypothetical protein